LKKTLRYALSVGSAVAVFSATAWVLQAQQGAIQNEGSIAPETTQQGRRGGRNAGPVLPTPRLADGTVNLGRVPGEKGIWNVPYITNMGMRLVGSDGKPLPAAKRAAIAAGNAARLFKLAVPASQAGG
jgi:hypothetical protein